MPAAASSPRTPQPELLAFVERTRIPVATTLMGVGAFPENHPLSLKWFGMHGTRLWQLGR